MACLADNLWATARRGQGKKSLLYQGKRSKNAKQGGKVRRRVKRNQART